MTPAQAACSGGRGPPGTAWWPSVPVTRGGPGGTRLPGHRAAPVGCCWLCAAAPPAAVQMGHGANPAPGADLGSRLGSGWGLPPACQRAASLGRAECCPQAPGRRAWGRQSLPPCVLLAGSSSQEGAAQLSGGSCSWVLPLVEPPVVVMVAVSVGVGWSRCWLLLLAVRAHTAQPRWVPPGGAGCRWGAAADAAWGGVRVGTARGCPSPQRRPRGRFPPSSSRPRPLRVLLLQGREEGAVEGEDYRESAAELAISSPSVLTHRTIINHEL